MRQREMPHPLCCISLDLGACSRATSDPPPDPHGRAGCASSVAVAGVLCKWTNIGKGWRYRWFSLHNGVLSYTKIRLRDPPLVLEGSGFRLIGKDVALISSATASNTQPGSAGCGYRKSRKPVRVIHLKISSFRESKTDGKRFYIFSSTKTLHLRTDSRKDRVAWIQSLISATKEISISKEISFMQKDIVVSTKKLRDHMQAEGLDEALIKDCEQIMHSEFAEYHRQLKLHYEENLGPFSVYHQQQLEEVDVEDMVTNKGQVQLTKYDYSSSGHEKFNEYSTTESSDGAEKQELDDLSDQEDLFFYDTNESFVDSGITCDSCAKASNDSDRLCGPEVNKCDANIMDAESQRDHQTTLLHISRRKKLPEPIEKEKAVSLWSMIKDNVGKDLTRVCLPVYFNEPLSSLQKCFEDLEYSHLLDQAYEYGKKGNSLMRILNVAAFAVSGYSSCDRLCKPFNPLLGETYEADYPEKGIRFFSEKVSHHPMLIACHCEGRGWKFWGDSNLRSKFWGQSIQLDPMGVLTLEFDDGEIFQWSKVTTTIHNLILGKLYCNHHGTMKIQGNQQYSCTLKFKEHSLLDRSPRQVQGFVEDTKGTKVATLLGKWDSSIYYSLGDDIWKMKSTVLSENATLLWRKSKPPADPTRYNLTSFAITLNELSSVLKDKLPPTDSRLRPDQRYLENGEYEKANAEKLRLEKRQRMSSKLQENGWKPKWFQRDSKDGTFRYVGGYWEAKEQKKWDDCLDIFGEFSSDAAAEPRN